MGGCKCRERDIVEHAMRCAQKAHDGQFRDDGVTPYFHHPDDVAKRVAKYGGTYIDESVAYFHDVDEECPNYNIAAALVQMRGAIEWYEYETILLMVKALTKDTSIEDRGERNMDSYRRVIAAPKGTILVKLCDRISNLNGKKLLDERYCRETTILIETLSPHVDGAAEHAALAELNRRHDHMKTLLRGVGDSGCDGNGD